MRLEQKTAQELILRKKTISVAESCTGGLLTHRLTNVSGSSAFLIATVVSYANQAKVGALKVPAAMISRYGAVSAPVAKRMAQNIRKIFKTDLGIAITGIAGPTGGTPQKPVGTVHICVCDAKHLVCEHNIFKGSRLQVKKRSADRALMLLLQLMKQ